MATIGNKEAPPDIETEGFDSLNFFKKCQRIQHHAAANDAGNAFVEDTGGNNMQDVTSIADADGVSGVVSTLITGHAIEAFGKDIDNLALAFIAPLEPDNCDVLLHWYLFQRSVWLSERISAFLFDFKQVFGDDWIKAALAETAAVDTAGIDIPWSIFGLFDEKRTADKDFAAGATARAFALAAGQKFFVLRRVDTRSEEAPSLADELTQAKADATYPGFQRAGRQTAA
jgi:hypothetical protein